VTVNAAASLTIDHLHVTDSLALEEGSSLRATPGNWIEIDDSGVVVFSSDSLNDLPFLDLGSSGSKTGPTKFGVWIGAPSVSGAKELQNNLVRLADKSACAAWAKVVEGIPATARVDCIESDGGVLLALTVKNDALMADQWHSIATWLVIALAAVIAFFMLK
jgi:hypothetical protein